MLLSYWRGDVGPCEPVIRRAVDGVYDWIYQGHGNWSFNAAYAGAQSALGLPLEALIARLPDLTEVEKWISAGTPVIASLSWEAGELTGAPIPSSKGHLVVITGFDISGNPIVNDPAAPVDAEVQRTYLRGEFENCGSAAPVGWFT